MGNLVIDDLASVQPWRPRCVEIRGWAEALRDTPAPSPSMSAEIIRIDPERVISFGLDSPPAGGPGQQQQSAVGQGGQGGQGGSENSPATALRWAQCMRAHGMPNFPNPDSNGTFNFGINSGVNQQSAAYQSGAQACRSIMPPPPGP
jgi:hypothetical protein